MRRYYIVEDLNSLWICDSRTGACMGSAPYYDPLAVARLEATLARLNLGA